ncbi:hypothetical protein K1T71_006159 [Dendrolimus kikuchii]|uniref:Uncharacterized protein n=1 Tax=Dendrolimus kikuchii TaxID=765133 RepID=A0ACC1D2Z5_9NEOP|nr:hypothetical protein K1T71_006159 [Dendrolimus kikuchii]
MNSLVVLLSVVVLAAAKPSHLLASDVLGASLIAAAPAAVSHQSRVDIKSSPAVITTAAVAPIAYTAPAAIAAPVAYAAPAAIATPVAYAAPAAVSQQSRIDIKTSPAITSTIVSSPVAYSAVSPAFVKTAAVTSAIAAPALIKSAAFVPGTIAAPAVVLDAPAVLAARTAHFVSNDLHLIKKRSAPVLSSHIVTPVVTTYSATPIVSSISAPLTYSAPLAYSTPLVAKTLSVHSW